MRYDAFISYRHAELDLYIAKKVHKGLETFRVPRAVAKKSGKKNIKRVFRDQEELPIGSDLGENISSALAESEFLLVICSPRTPESYWVQKEISTFIQMHDREHVLAILVEGEPEDSFPEQLLKDENGNPVEPLAADVRGRTKSEINKKLKTEIMRLAAPLLHCSYDDLRQRHRERRMKKIAAVSLTVAALAVAFGAYNVYNAALIRQNLEGKQRNQSKYLADTSLELLEEGDRRAAVLVALEALPSEKNDRPYVPEAQYALSEALHCYETGNEITMDRVLQHDFPVSDFYFNVEGTKLASVDQGGYVYVWDVETGEKLAQIAPEKDDSGYILQIINAAVYNDQVIICDEDSLRSVDCNGQEKWRMKKDDSILYCTIDETAELAACVMRDEVVFVDITDGQERYVMPNQSKYSYAGKMAFNQDKTKFAVSHLIMDENVVTGCISVYDFAAQTVTDINTTATYIADIVFTADDCVAVAGWMETDILNDGQPVERGYVEKLDEQSNTALWCREYEHQIVSIDSGNTQIKSRSYQDEESGEQHDEILVSVDNTAYAWDSITGEPVAEVNAGSGITKLLVSEISGLAYLAESNGAIDIVNMTTGTSYPDVTIETGKIIRDVAVKNGVLVIRGYASPSLTVMKYQEGAGMVELENYENSIQDICYSREETYYAVKLFGDELQDDVRFYQSSDNSLVGTWMEGEDDQVLASGFMDDKNYVAVCGNGTIVFYDVSAGVQEGMNTGNKNMVFSCDMNKEYSLALLYGAESYTVVDLQKREVVQKGETEGYIDGAILSEDGQWIYCSMEEEGVCRIEVKTGKAVPVDLEGYEVQRNGEVQDAFSVSADGSLLAVSCQDGMLRVLDVEKMKTVSEIPFLGVDRRFIEFSDDNTEIMLQGDDYYFRVYNLKQEEFSHISAEQYYEIENAVVDEASGTISLMTSADMVILNKEDYERIAQVDGGKAYLPGQAKILCNNTRMLYQFPYMTLEMLKEEAEKQFAGETLTDMEKIKYYIE